MVLEGGGLLTEVGTRMAVDGAGVPHFAYVADGKLRHVTRRLELERLEPADPAPPRLRPGDEILVMETWRELCRDVIERFEAEGRFAAGGEIEDWEVAAALVELSLMHPGEDPSWARFDTYVELIRLMEIVDPAATLQDLNRYVRRFYFGDSLLSHSVPGIPIQFGLGERSPVSCCPR